MKSPYLQYKDYMRERYGDPLFRVPIDFNFGCPNRESDGSGGCTSCNVRGWSPFEGITFKSSIAATLVNGQIAYTNGQVNDTLRGQRLLFDR